ncbi:hypothetical protein HC031_06660 [Planosporangium thailandense]|uniref:Uncharacterized protein n=1 Tax=Planosporangium thailandense TaxID=765197 RepID=A0ABX0XUC2_9ACTN|nr:hypothetical protein [Planosporangium thailandense]NJC69401.1 hypothetical protein [Planosporangium thailandense]
MRREQARWRLSAALLSLLLAFGAATCQITADRSVPNTAPDSPAAVMAAGGTSAAHTAAERQGHPRLTVGRGHTGLLLFLAALAPLLAGVRRPRAWSLTTIPPWSPPTTFGAWTSRGRAPPAPMRLA